MGTWTSQPDTRTGTATDNTKLYLNLKIANYTNDLGVTAWLAKVLVYYAAACQKPIGSVHTAVKETAGELRDRYPRPPLLKPMPQRAE